MKKILRRAMVLICILALAVSSASPALALKSSLSKKTGYKVGQVIRRDYGYKGSGRTRARYVKAKDVYVSEKVVTDKFVKSVTAWNATKSVTSLSYNKSTTISATGSADVVKALGYKVSITMGKTSSAGGAHKVDPKKGTVAQLAIKCDYIQVTYRHETYNSSGKLTGSSIKTVLIPIQGSQVYYVRYSK